jgi:hypothetical protein
MVDVRLTLHDCHVQAYMRVVPAFGSDILSLVRPELEQRTNSRADHWLQRNFSDHKSVSLQGPSDGFIRGCTPHVPRCQVWFTAGGHSQNDQCSPSRASPE